MHTDIDADVLRSQTALRDIVALSAIPAVWTGRGPPAVATGLADALVELLQLDFVFVRLEAPGGTGTVDVTRGSAWPRFAEWLQGQLATSARLRRKEIVRDLGDDSEPSRGLVISVGFNGEAGLVAVASSRGDFPTAIDELLLSLAANQAATAFQNARTEEELRKARDELETRVAERTGELGRITEEQAALRRVATLVAEGAPPGDLFAAVVAEVGRLLPVGSAAMGRYDPDGMFTTVAAWSAHKVAFAVGRRWVPEGNNITAIVFRTGRPARLDDFSNASGTIGVHARRAGYRSAVGSPIMVEGRLWGVMTAASTADQPLPADTDARLASFTNLVATSIANAESREALERLAAEQAALRRVATLVAQGGAPGEILDAVAGEVQTLFHAAQVALNRFEPDEEIVVLAHRGLDVARTPVGSRVSHAGENVTTIVRRTGRPARIEKYENAEGPLAELARATGLRSSVSAPIVVEGAVWGLLTASWKSEEPPPPDTEDRMARFAHLLDTGIANAEARGQVARLVEEQAALGRVATLVAQEASQAKVFATIATEIGHLLGLEEIRMVRCEDERTGVVVAHSGQATDLFPVGFRLPLGVDAATSRVFLTGQPVRIDDYTTESGTITETVRSAGIRGVVATPVLVEGRLWGAMTAATTQEEPLPPDTESRLAQFTELLATAIANSESREALSRLAEEQSALRRVATLVARGVPPADIFSAVSHEVERLLGFDAETSDAAMVIRFDPGPECVFVGASRRIEGTPLGTRWKPLDLFVSTRVLRTGRSARVDESDLVSAGGSVAEKLRREGYVWQVGTPIVVEGRPWGATTVSARDRLPPGTEERLEKFSEIVATAIANAKSRSELARSRRRIVAASDETRRRIERDLHDGTQQRLVSLGLALRAAEADVPPDNDDLRDELAQVATGLAEAVDELRELSRGIHPAILSKGGLAPALRALARRSATPVEVDVTTDARYPEPIEIAAYFVASEALANVAKHARASRIDVSLAERDGGLLLSIRDDGVGGADPALGSGLVGLSDRVEALGGSLHVRSRPGDGTHVTAALPLEPGPAADAG